MDESPDVEDIRRRMQQIRCDLDSDVQGIVEHAKEMADWRYYVRQYPWACAGAAAALGYFIVPRRLHVSSPDPKVLEELIRKHGLVVSERRADQKGGLSGAIFGMVSSLVMRGLLAYVGQQAGKMVGQQAAEQTGPADPPPQQPHPSQSPFNKPR